jgi:hypothetical protein
MKAGEAGGPNDLESIAKIAEAEIRERLSRYPGVRLEVAGQQPAVGAGNTGKASAEPTTLSGSLGGETSTGPAEIPPFGTREWKAHMLRTASTLGF